MSSLYATLDTTLQSLQAQQAGLDTVTNNIANVNTPGYSRQRVVLQEIPSFSADGVGGGVQLQSVQSITDNVLELRLHQENQTQSGLNSYLSAANQSQALFNDTQGAGIQSAISGFFNSLQQLSTNPADVPTRQNVVLSAQGLAQVFNRTASSLNAQRNNLDTAVTDTVTQANQLTTQIAKLNTRIEQLQGSGQSTSALGDQRTQLIRQLSGFIDVSVINSGHGGVTVATTAGTALVVGGESVPLSTQLDSASGRQHVYSQGADITAKIQSGQIGGDIKARDQLIPGLLNQLDQLAAGVANAVNTQNQAGTDLNGAKGGNFFVAPPAGTTGAAGQFAVALTDPAQIAASSDGSSGSNGNVTALAALVSQGIVNGKTPGDSYSNLVSGLGSDISSNTAEQDASNLTLQQLQSQRNAVSGVNLDEESASLIQFQRAYQAAAQVASVINGLTQTALNLGTGA